ncbi:Mov34/MPN/PAD-1 family protein [Mesorhizobium sp. CA7]|uniref:Mov34/MPN/PAD-1 family protein n=1 Tax=Mesorhizobium sp. CA7 TaxID=588501 RepID=UPI001CC95C68|nr:Mov34/MPN/PAD-1 family protein [Mesorhizobium sp. CA7]
MTPGDGRFILIHAEIIGLIESSVERGHPSREAGGILLGSYRGDHIEVSGFTTPYPQDRRSFALFDRIDPLHQSSALRTWQQSTGTDTYIGEWHTHPEASPSPSWLDRRTWRKLINRSHAPMVFAIGGFSDIWWGLGDVDGIRSLYEHVE